MECEERLKEYKESSELKEEIERACEARLQAYKDSPDLKAEIAEACQTRLAEYQASDEMKMAIWKKGFRMFVSGFNRGLKEARQAPSTSLAKLRAAEVDSDGKTVFYGEDDLPLPKGTSHASAGLPCEDSKADEGDDEASEEVGPEGLEIVPFVGTGRSEQEGARSFPYDNSTNVDKDNAGDDVPRNISPLRTIFPPACVDD